MFRKTSFNFNQDKNSLTRINAYIVWVIEIIFPCFFILLLNNFPCLLHIVDDAESLIICKRKRHENNLFV